MASPKGHIKTFQFLWIVMLQLFLYSNQWMKCLGNFFCTNTCSHLLCPVLLEKNHPLKQFKNICPQLINNLNLIWNCRVTRVFSISRVGSSRVKKYTLYESGRVGSSRVGSWLDPPLVQFGSVWHFQEKPNRISTG